MKNSACYTLKSQLKKALLVFTYLFIILIRTYKKQDVRSKSLKKNLVYHSGNVAFWEKKRKKYQYEQVQVYCLLT